MEGDRCGVERVADDRSTKCKTSATDTDRHNQVTSVSSTQAGMSEYGTHTHPYSITNR